MTFQVRQFDLSGVQGLSKKAIDTHLGLYKAYVENLNKLLESSPTSSTPPLQVDGYNRRFAFEYNGVVLHEIFFEQLTGKAGAPNTGGAFAAAVQESHGGFDAWKGSIEALTKTRGVGWVLTIRERGSSKLYNFWTDLHHLNMPANRDVVFALDLWEHAFIIDFAPSQKADYVKAIFNSIDWSVIDERYSAIAARDK